ncbi:MAG: hypothetical protein AAGA56_13010 [Myxococcota bacterium]
MKRGGLILMAVLFAAPVARAAEEDLDRKERSLMDRLDRARGTYGHLMLHSHFGGALRFNNPFRLARPLGDTEESISATAPYHDLGVSFAFGPPTGLRHGASLRLALALEGVAQQAFGVAYFTSYRFSDMWLGYGRLGISILAEPDANVGGQLALGAVWYFTGAAGLSLETVGDLYYGAATLESDVSTIPLLGLQGGLVLDWEVLP